MDKISSLGVLTILRFLWEMFIFSIVKSPSHGDCFTVTLSSLCVQAAEGARSPAVFAAMVSYIRDVLDVFGIELLHTAVRV